MGFNNELYKFLNLQGFWKPWRFLGLIFLLFRTSLSAQPLPELLETLKQENLELLQKDKERDLVKAKAQLAGLPTNNPSVSIGAFPLPVETRLGAQTFRVSVAQPLLWKGTYQVRQENAFAGTEVSVAEKKWSYQQLANAFSKVYFQFTQADQDKRVLEEQLDLLKTWEDISLQQYKAGKSRMANILRIRMQQKELQTSIENLLNNKLSLQARLNGWLNRSANSVIEVEETDEKTFTEGTHPQAEVIASKMDQLSKKEKLISIEKKPMLGVGIDYINIRKRSDMELENNGKDALMVMGTLQIPLFNQRRFRSQLQEVKIQQQQLDLASQQLEREKENQQAFWFAQLEIANNNLGLLNELIAENEEVIALLLQEYSTSGSGFEELLQAEKQQLGYQLQINQWQTRKKEINAEIRYWNSGF